MTFKLAIHDSLTSSKQMIEWPAEESAAAPGLFIHKSRALDGTANRRDWRVSHKSGYLVGLHYPTRAAAEQAAWRLSRVGVDWTLSRTRLRKLSKETWAKVRKVLYVDG